MGASSPPKAPNPNKAYKAGIQTYLNFLPKLLAGEQQARTQYDPQRIEEQQGLQQKYGPQMYSDQLKALRTLDPTGTALRTQLGQRVASDLSLGTQLDPATERQTQQEIRGAQTARGNILGNAPANAEALYEGQRGQQLYQQRLGNAGAFLAGATPEQQLLSVSSVQPDRSSQYVNPNAGYLGQQFGLSNYQNLLAQQAASGGGANPWTGALSGAIGGATAGSSIAPPYGTIVGGIAGGLLGGLGTAYSDRRLKNDIRSTYLEKAGVDLKTFRYKDDPVRQKYLGVMAQELATKHPEHVGSDGEFLTVSSEFAPVPIQ